MEESFFSTIKLELNLDDDGEALIPPHRFYLGTGFENIWNPTTKQ